MELYAGASFLVILIASMIFFRGSVKRVADYSEKVILINTKEGELELTERANTIANRLKDIGDVRIDDLDGLFASKGINK